MTAQTICSREDELLDAMARGYVGSELDAHATGCASCGELRLVAGALLDDRREAFEEAPLPSSGTMWWRMRIRQRQEAVAKARLPLLIGQAAGLAIAIALMVFFFGPQLTATARHVVDAVRVSTPLLIGIGASILAFPIAGWVAIRQK